MATNPYTSDYTIANVRRRGLIPTNGKLADADLLAFLNDAQQDLIVPMLSGAGEDFLHATEHTALVAGQTEYAMPARAASERLVRVALVAATTTDADDELPLNRVETSRRDYGNSGFELADNTIVLREVPSGYSYLRVVYVCMPNRLVTLASAGRVTAKTATTVTVSSVPSGFTSSETYDFISGTPGFRWKGVSKTASGLAGSDLTFTSGDIPSTLAVGDYVALAGETPIAQVPVSLRSLHEQAAACLALEALGDSRLERAEKRLERMQKDLAPTLKPRVKTAPRVIVNRFSAGTARRLPYPFG